MQKAIATPPGEPTEYVDLTPAEVAAKNTADQAWNDGQSMRDWERDMAANLSDDLENIIDALDAPTRARISGDTIAKYNAKKTLRAQKPGG